MIPSDPVPGNPEPDIVPSGEPGPGGVEADPEPQPEVRP